MNVFIILKTNYWKSKIGHTNLVSNNYFNSIEEAKLYIHKKEENNSDYQYAIKHGKHKDNKGYNEYNTIGIDNDGAWTEYKIIELKQF